MSLYYEAADFLTSTAQVAGSLKSRIFSKKDLKSQPAQIYAIVIETCKWSAVLKEVIEAASLLSLEPKLTPILSVILVHDLLLARKGVALPATHGLRVSVERHKARLQAEFTKARLRRSMSSLDALRSFIDLGGDTTSDLPHPRWVRINTIKTHLEDQLETTFQGFDRVSTVKDVRMRGVRRIYIDENVPNLVAVSPTVDLAKSKAYSNGEIIFQDKASCFPAYLLDPLPEDGDIVDACAAPGNKTTHIAAILVDRLQHEDDHQRKIHAFEKNKARAETLKRMLNMAGTAAYTSVYAGQDFLQVDPSSATWKNVGALLLDPSCSGSGIVGRDDMPPLCLPVKRPDTGTKLNGNKKLKRETAVEKTKDSAHKHSAEPEALLDDDGEITAVSSGADLQARLSALSSFQLSLLLHAMSFPAACKITYSTCSTHVEENEAVVEEALGSKIAQDRGWKILARDQQIGGLRDWPVRGSPYDNLTHDGSKESLRDACIRANKGDELGTMGFFLAGFVRDRTSDIPISDRITRDEKGHIVRDMLGIPLMDDSLVVPQEPSVLVQDTSADDDVWNGFEDEHDPDMHPTATLDRAVEISSETVDPIKLSHKREPAEPLTPKKKRNRHKS